MKVVEIDREDWRFIVYEVDDIHWFVDFHYSPVSFFDSSMTIKLTRYEKLRAKLNRNYLFKLSDKIRYSYRKFIHRDTKLQLHKIASNNRSGNV